MYKQPSGGEECGGKDRVFFFLPVMILRASHEQEERLVVRVRWPELIIRFLPIIGAHCLCFGAVCAEMVYRFNFFFFFLGVVVI